MPYFGKDWRSSGDIWIKTPNGWRKAALLRQKLLENLSQSILLRFFRKRMSDLDITDVTEPSLKQHPQVFLNKVGTRKVIAPEIDEALAVMDMVSSVHDVRRVQYVILLTKLMIEKFTDLSVQVQKTIVCILEELVVHCERTLTDTPAVRRLVVDLERILASSRFFHVNQSSLLASRSKLLIFYRNRLDSCSSSSERSTTKTNILSLPDDCLLAIAHRFADPYDVVRLGATCKRLSNVCNNQHIWQSLFELYFSAEDMRRIRSAQQLQDMTRVKGDSPLPIDWRSQCLRMYRPYRLVRTFADQPRLCQTCWCVFWKLSGHQCALRSKDIGFSGRDVSPGDFLHLLVSG